MSISHIVDANYRYIAAYQEVNARIAQRQQALILYVTLVVSLLAAIIALQSVPGDREFPIEWLAMGFPAASISLVFLNYKAERAITHLRHFLSALEQLNNAHEFLPSYNTETRWAQSANGARRYQDWAAAVLVSGGNGIGLGAIYSIYPNSIEQHPWLLWLTGALTVFSLLALLLIPLWGYRSASQIKPLNT